MSRRQAGPERFEALFRDNYTAVSRFLARRADRGTAEELAAEVFEIETWAVALLAGAATLFFGIVPSPLFDLAVDAGHSFTGLF